MTEMLYGSRFLDGIDLTDLPSGSRYLDEADDLDSVIEYTPRHLRAAALSPELQAALDAAFAPEEEPVTEPAPESMPLPEPVPTRAAEAEFEPAEEVDDHNLCMVIPETVEYPAVLPGLPAVEPALPETIFREAVEPAPRPAAVPVPEHTPVSPTPFPAQNVRDARRDDGGKHRSHRVGHRRRPLKVDVSRLMVPSPPRVANG